MKTTRRPHAAFLGALIAAARALAALDPAEWPRQLDVAVPAPGLTRLALSPATLAPTRADRGDVRLLGPDGREVPWRLHRDATDEPPRTEFAPGPVAARVEGRATVLEFDTRTDRVLSGLRLVTPATGFLKPATLHAADDSGWQFLAGGVPLYQAYQGATEVRLDFKPGRYRRLRLTLDDRRTAPIPVPSVVLLAAPAAPAEVADTPVVLRERSEEGTVTRIRLDLGASGLDVAWLELAVPDPFFTRPVAVVAERVEGDAVVATELVRGVVHRFPTDGNPPEDSRRLRVGRRIPARDVFLLVENGDSPPLGVDAVRIGVQPQSLEFWAAKAGNHRLLAGNPVATAPRYDIERAAVPGDVVPRLVALDAAWAANPAYREPAAGPGSLGLGGPFDARGWRHARAIAATPGAAALELPGDVAAALRPDFADVRIVASGRQVPFVADPRPLRRSVAATATPAKARPGSRSSAWRIDPPVPGAPLSALRIDTAQTAFERPVRWVEVIEPRDGPAWTNVLASGTWRRVPGTPPKPMGLVAASRARSGPTWIEVEDGDNPPLPGLSVAGEFETRRLLFLAPAGTVLQLAYGNAEAGPPRYDLALVAERLNALPSAAATLGPATPARADLGDALSGPVARIAFWAVLAGVVALLLAVVRKLLPAPADGPGKPIP